MTFRRSSKFFVGKPATEIDFVTGVESATCSSDSGTHSTKTRDPSIDVIAIMGLRGILKKMDGIPKIQAKKSRGETSKTDRTMQHL